MATTDRQISSEWYFPSLQSDLLRNVALTGMYVHCVYAFTPPTPHKSVIQVTPDPPSMGGGAGKPN